MDAANGNFAVRRFVAKFEREKFGNALLGRYAHNRGQRMLNVEANDARFAGDIVIND